MKDALVYLKGISKTFAERVVLQEVQLQINVRDRIGLVGSNGTGKTTMLDLLAGIITCDSGSIDWVRPSSVNYMTQSRNEALCPSDSNLDQWAKRLDLPDDIIHGGVNRLERASGGERTKIALVQAFSSDSDILILDEPTNHLDAKGIAWLINQVNGYAGTVLMVSHDRYFLDQTVNRIGYLSDGQLNLYNGNYSSFVNQRKQEQQTLLHAFEKQQKEQERLETQIAQVKQWAEEGHRKAGKQGTLSERRQMGYKQFHRAKSRKLDQRAKSQIRRLEKLRSKPVEKPTQVESVQFHVTEALRHGTALIEATGIGKQFDGHVLFKDSSFYLQRGDRVGLYGPNGCGKTTFLKIIIGAESLDQGELWKSPSLKFSYLSQDDMAVDANTMGKLEQNMTPNERSKFRTSLAYMGLSEQKLASKKLSFGERVRLKLVWLALQEYNVLILDEPTNHLDVLSREELERALASYKGTLLVATHDRYFMQRLCTKLLLFEDQKIIKTEGGIPESDKPVTGSQMAKGYDMQNIEHQMMLIQTRITQLLGDLSKLIPGQEEYGTVSSELDNLLRELRELKNQK